MYKNFELNLIFIFVFCIYATVFHGVHVAVHAPFIYRVFVELFLLHLSSVETYKKSYACDYRV